MFNLLRSLRAFCAQLLGAFGARGFEGGRRPNASRVRIVRARALLFGVGSTAGLSVMLAAAPWSPWGTWSRGTPRVTGWVLADRGADQLLQIDRELRVIGWSPAAEPLRVVSRAPGSAVERAVAGPDAWWIEGLGGDPFGPHRLHALGLPLPNGVGLPPSEPVAHESAGGQWDYLRDLAVDARGVAFVLAGPLQAAQGELWCVRSGTAPVKLATLEGAQHLALAGATLWCGGAQGRLWRLATDGSVLDETQVGAEVHALAASGTDLWCLDAAGVLRRLDADMDVLWSADLGFTPGPLAVDRDDQAWIAAEGQPFVQPVDADGVLLTPVTDVGGDSWTDLDAHAPAPLGAAPGYVLQLDAFGAAFASQGGFGYLSDVAPLFAAGS